MPVTRAQAKEICTKPEYELVEASFRPAVTEFTPARLRSKIERARKLQDKYRDLTRQQNRGTKETERSREASNQRTERKTRLFDETRERFEKRLAQIEAKGEGDAGGPRTSRARSRQASGDKRRERRQTKQELTRKAAR